MSDGSRRPESPDAAWSTSEGLDHGGDTSRAAENQALFDTLVDGVSLGVDGLLTKEELFGLFAVPVPSR